MNKVSVMYDLKRVNGKINKALTNGLKNYNLDVTPVQSRIIMFTYEKSEVTATDILDKFNSINKSTLSEILNNLEKNGYINRSGSLNDSRKKLIVLTDKARDVVKVLEKNFDDVAHRVLDTISKEDYEAFSEILKKMERNIDEIC